LSKKGRKVIRGSVKAMVLATRENRVSLKRGGEGGTLGKSPHLEKKGGEKREYSKNTKLEEEREEGEHLPAF